MSCLYALMLFCLIRACVTRAHGFGMEGKKKKATRQIMWHLLTNCVEYGIILEHSGQLSHNQTLWAAGESARATHREDMHADRKRWRQPKIHFSRLHLPHLLSFHNPSRGDRWPDAQQLEPLQISRLFFCHWTRRSRGRNTGLVCSASKNVVPPSERLTWRPP